MPGEVVGERLGRAWRWRRQGILADRKNEYYLERVMRRLGAGDLFAEGKRGSWRWRVAGVRGADGVGVGESPECGGW